MSLSTVGASLKTKLTSLLSEKATFALPGEDAFATAMLRYTECSPPGIAIVVFPSTEKDLADTVSYATTSKIPLLVRNTGHAYPTSLNRKIKDGIQLMIDGFRKLELNDDGETITVGAGVRTRDVVDFLYERGKQLTVGSCDDVGLIGASLGGGLGRLQGLHGLMGDNISSARVILASGEIANASPTENADLLWALKGSGHNFGLVVEAQYRVYELIPKVYNANRIFAGDKLEQVIEVLKSVTPPPKDTSIYLCYAWMPENQVVLLLDYAFMGPEEEGRARFDKLFGSIEYVQGWDAVHDWNKLNREGSGGLTKGLGEMGLRKSPHSAALLSYDASTMRVLYEEFVTFLNEYPQLRKTAFAFESYPQEAVKAVSPEESSFGNRDANIIVLIMPWYEDSNLDEIASQWARKIRSILHSNSGFQDKKPRGYLNYGHGDEAVEELYGHDQNRLERLRILKKKYDPTGLFSSYNPISDI